MSRPGKFLDTLTKIQKGIVESEEKEQTHRENLQWAILAAGRMLRTGQPPVSCPNDAAFFLYKQAESNPKEFLTKVTQMEAKADGSHDNRPESQKSLEEVEKILSQFQKEENENGAS